MLKILIYIVIFSSLLLSGNPGKEEKEEVGLDDSKLGNFLPLDLKFVNEKGIEVSLGDLVNKPTIFMFVYYKCPTICSPLLAEVASQVTKVDLAPGRDYQIISISIDYTESFNDAATKKTQVIQTGRTGLPDDSWHFLTGDSASVKLITQAAGITYKKFGDQIVHPAVIMVTGKDGKITRYIIGPRFLPFDIKMAVYEATEGKIVPTIAKVLKFCFNYDPQGETYVLNTTRIFGTLIILGAILLTVFLVVKTKKESARKV